MADIEKVIKGLEETETMLIQAVDRGVEMSVTGAFKCLNRVTDALELLKEYKRQDGCPCTHCMEWECDEVCKEYKKWRNA